MELYIRTPHEEILVGEVEDFEIRNARGLNIDSHDAKYIVTENKEDEK